MQTISFLATANAVLLFSTAWLLIRGRPAAEGDTQARALAELLGETDDISRQVEAIAADVTQLQGQLALQAHRYDNDPPQQEQVLAAERLVRAGCDAQEIAASCAISPADAQLLIRCQSIKARPVSADN